MVAQARLQSAPATPTTNRWQRGRGHTNIRGWERAGPPLVARATTATRARTAALGVAGIALITGKPSKPSMVSELALVYGIRTVDQPDEE